MIDGCRIGVVHMNSVTSTSVLCAGPEFSEEKNCIFIGMATEDLDVAELVETIVSIGRDIEESGKVCDDFCFGQVFNNWSRNIKSETQEDIMHLCMFVTSCLRTWRRLWEEAYRKLSSSFRKQMKINLWRRWEYMFRWTVGSKSLREITRSHLNL